jgi:hypothetical protein
MEVLVCIWINFSKHLKRRGREKRGGIHQTNTNYHLLEVSVFLGVLVPTNTKLTYVFGSKVLVLVLVCYKLTLTPPSKHDHNVVIIPKKGEKGIRSRAQETGRGSQDGQWRNCCQSMVGSTAAEVVIPMYYSVPKYLHLWTSTYYIWPFVLFKKFMKI